MNLLSRLAVAAADPVFAAYRLRAIFDAEGLWRRQEKLYRQAGFRRPLFLLSFDCDTEKDFRVVEDVHARLADHGITPVYAVPGELLERGAAIYRRLLGRGATFINHGHAEHTRLDETTGVYEGLLFYDRMTPEAVRRDIEDGHATLQRVLDVTPTGFRMPHLGSFQTRAAFELIHRVLGKLGYRFSTSGMPLVACRQGPYRSRSGVWEIPITGCASQPLRSLNSWSFRYAPGARHTQAEYLIEAEGLRRLLVEGRSLFVNLYADPSQVYDWPEFFSAMAGFAPWAIPSYDHLLDGLET